MKKYYSHFTYIYPDTYLRNTVVEMDNNNNIVNVFPFEKELERTQFYSGILFFIPNTMRINKYFVDYTRKKVLKSLGEDENKDVDVNAIICNIEE